VTAIVGIHGVGNHHYVAASDSVASATNAISGEWADALEQGLAGFGISPTAPPGLRVAYYAHLLHRGTPQGSDNVTFLDENEEDLLIDWVDQLAPAAVPLGQRTARARSAAEWLIHRFGDHALGLALKFVREASAYLNCETRRKVCDAVAEVIARELPRVVIAHSLGTVVAYETLWEHPELSVDLLLTLGSPLAMPKVIFERLDPEPVSGRGQCPPGVAAWANLADAGDIVAIPRAGLAPYFDGITHDAPAIVIGKNAFHSVTSYLAAPETAAVLAPYLNDQDS
jgi:pimeloyl-ACP methyl ester carboxylesterase